MFNFFNKVLNFAYNYLRALAYTLYLFSLGWIFQKNRELLFKVILHFNPRALQKIPELLPRSDLKELIAEPLLIRIGYLKDNPGDAPLQDICLLGALVKKQDPKAILEIGTFDGRSTFNMALNSGPDTVIYTLDLPRKIMDQALLSLAPQEKVFIDKQESGSKFRALNEKDFPEKKKIVQLYGDSGQFDFTPYFGKMDFVFIDGSHSYEYVINDSRLGLKLLREGRGLIIWHDYGYWEGVTRGLNELSQTPEFQGMVRIENTGLVCLWK